MKTYDFDRIKVRPFLTLMDAQNKYIFQDGTHVINVSLESKAEVKNYVEMHGGTYDWFPLNETPRMEVENLVLAVKSLFKYASTGLPIIVHCLCGNNRSRTVVEAYYFAKYGEQLEDEYKGFANHLLYNVANGYLPSMEEILHRLDEMRL
ncbi:MAG: dual specificity protein phosphatase family protein [Bacteroidales bacterium]|nr:dual specificity protein phosphatase family protein [Bacteroidales bacterium]